ncbi:unnamed protein product, partial [Rotaria sp. Silwood1]
MFDLGCFSPIITLSPSNSSLTSPLQYRQSEDFSISSYIQLNCNSSLSIITKWIISTCISTCSFPSYLGQTIKTHLSEIFIPARTFNYGIYKLTLTVTMSIASYLTSSISAYVKIILSNLTVNIIQFGTSMITQGYQQDLILDPEKYSINPDTNTFNARNFLTIDDSRIDLNNPSCLSNQSNNGTKSSLIIFANSLKSNEIYQFKVSMKNLQNSSTQAIVTDSFLSGTSSSALDFIINHSPQYVSCSINPYNGTTSTLFDISCTNWQDQDGIQDYSFYCWTIDPTQSIILTYSTVPTIQFRLPSRDCNTSPIHRFAR